MANRRGSPTALRTRLWLLSAWVASAAVCSHQARAPMRAAGHRSPGAETPPLPGSSCCVVALILVCCQSACTKLLGTGKAQFGGSKERKREERGGGERGGDPREEDEGHGKQSLSAHQACPLPLVLSLRTTKQSLAPSSLHPPFRYLYKLVRSPLSFLVSRLNSPSSLSLSSHVRCSTPFIIFVALC